MGPAYYVYDLQLASTTDNHILLYSNFIQCFYLLLRTVLAPLLPVPSRPRCGSKSSGPDGWQPGRHLIFTMGQFTP